MMRIKRVSSIFCETIAAPSWRTDSLRPRQIKSNIASLGYRFCFRHADAVSKNPKIDNLANFKRYGANVGVTCRCGHKGTIDRATLERYFLMMRWDTRLIYVLGHLRCTRCKARLYQFGLSFDLPTVPNWGPKTEDDWRRLLKRMWG